MDKRTAPRVSPTVDMLRRECNNPNADKEHIAAAAEGMMDAVSEPIDKVWLRMVLARTLPKEYLDEAITHLEEALRIAQQNSLRRELILVSLMLYTKLVEADRREEANDVLAELGDLALDKVEDTVLIVSDAVLDGLSKVTLRAGMGLTWLGARLASSSHTKAHGTTTNRQD